MKSVVALLLAACVCLASSETVSKWGNTNGRVLGEEIILAEGAHSQYQTRAFSFPLISKKVDPIIGIRHYNNAESPVQVTFIDGGIGRKDVHFLLKSKRNQGINSRFVFYGM